MIWYDMIYDMIWYDMIWYDMIWFYLHKIAALRPNYNVQYKTREKKKKKKKKKPEWPEQAKMIWVLK